MDDKELKEMSRRIVEIFDMEHIELLTRYCQNEISKQYRALESAETMDKVTKIQGAIERLKLMPLMREYSLNIVKQEKK